MPNKEIIAFSIFPYDLDKKEIYSCNSVKDLKQSRNSCFRAYNMLKIENIKEREYFNF